MSILLWWPQVAADDQPPLGGSERGTDLDAYAAAQADSYPADDVQGVQAAPLHDGPAVEDDILGTSILVSVEDDVAFDVAFFSLVRGPPDQDDNYVPPFVAPDFGATDDGTLDHESGIVGSPLEDEPADGERVAALFPDTIDADDVADSGCTAGPPDDAAADDEERAAASFPEFEVDDAEEAGGLTQGPPDDAAIDEERAAASFPEFEDDVAVAEAWLSEPPDQDDEYVEGAAASFQEFEDDVAVAEAWLSEPPDQDDEYVAGLVSQHEVDDAEDTGEIAADGLTGSPLADAPAGDDTITGRSVPEVVEPEANFDDVGHVWSVFDPTAPVEPPAPVPVIPAGQAGAGWWIEGSRKRKPVKWPDLPDVAVAPPWRPKVVTPRDARIRVAEASRRWKQKMRRARQAEDEIVLAIIAALIAEGDE